MKLIHRIKSLFLFSLFIMPLLFQSQLATAQSSVPGAAVSGKWNLTVDTKSGERPSWIEIHVSGINTLAGHFVGIEGSTRPVSKITYSEDNGMYSFSIPPQWLNIETDLTFEFTKINNDQLSGTTTYDDTVLKWTGVRAPSLSRTSEPEWGNSIPLIDNQLSKWIISENNRFKVENGVLINEDSGGNLVTKNIFNDFKLNLEFNIPEGSNSGLYLRGRYEVQIMDSYGTQPSSTSTTGGIYGFIDPTVNASKPYGEWQSLEVTLTGRVVTVVLNGTEVICNRTIPGITGGALDSHESQPGPIMIQGDHGSVKFRNITITPSKRS